MSEPTGAPDSRERRLALVLAALHERVHELEQRGARVPEPLRAAIAGFEAQVQGQGTL